jgi:phenylalanyl-tRNA synthetase alpha chain
MSAVSGSVFSEIDQLESEILSGELNSEADLENWRIRYLGSKGAIKHFFGRIAEVEPARKKEFGLRMNAVKQKAELRLAEVQALLKQPTTSGSTLPDLTLPGNPVSLGSRHPVMIVRQRIIGIFARLGFSVAEGPEIVNDWLNFSALNFEPDHPARDLQDTFFLQLNPDVLLRTHTSTVQVQEMQKGILPIRSIMPGRVYRNETISARAHCFFHQVEGLYIDEQVSFADMKQTLLLFARDMFGSETRIRLRPSYFPFTEPSAEMDVSCFICNAKGCPVCKHSGWVEIMGCGMVDPQVLSNCGIDAERYTGFAFGMGIERITMLTYGISDIRILSENDLRFLAQFKSAF